MSLEYWSAIERRYFLIKAAASAQSFPKPSAICVEKIKTEKIIKEKSLNCFKI